MNQTAIPFLFMRGGTSRGPYFLRSSLPEDRDQLAKVLLAALGAGSRLNIDGIGGGHPLTTKVAMLSRSDHPEADVDYLFAQVISDRQEVDFSPSCGNILSGVGPAAIEMGLVDATEGHTTVRIRAVNTGSLIEAEIQTPDRQVEYDGTCHIDGVPGTSAPVRLRFSEVVGAATGVLFPTGSTMETIDGIDVSCVDAAMPVVFAQASAFGLSGYESAAELSETKAFFDRMEPIRIEAGSRMGLGDVSSKVVPKFALIAPPRDGGMVASRYFMPWSCHTGYAVTGAVCLCACILSPGTVAGTVIPRPGGPEASIRIEHPAGFLDMFAEFALSSDKLDLVGVGTVRTARKLVSGEVYVPAAIWRKDRTGKG